LNFQFDVETFKSRLDDPAFYWK